MLVENGRGLVGLPKVKDVHFFILISHLPLSLRNIVQIFQAARRWLIKYCQQFFRQHCRLSICSYFGWLWQILNLRRGLMQVVGHSGRQTCKPNSSSSRYWCLAFLLLRFFFQFSYGVYYVMLNWRKGNITQLLIVIFLKIFKYWDGRLRLVASSSWAEVAPFATKNWFLCRDISSKVKTFVEIIHPN